MQVQSWSSLLLSKVQLLLLPRKGTRADDTRVQLVGLPVKITGPPAIIWWSENRDPPFQTDCIGFLTLDMTLSRTTVHRECLTYHAITFEGTAGQYFHRSACLTR